MTHATLDGDGGLRQTESTRRSETFVTNQGALRLTWTPSGAVRIHVRGHGDARFAGPTARRLQSFSGAQRMVLLFDFAQMEKYDSALRSEYTSMVMQSRAAISELFVHAESAIVNMGVSVANVALGGFIKAVRDRGIFEAELRKHGLADI